MRFVVLFLLFASLFGTSRADVELWSHTANRESPWVKTNHNSWSSKGYYWIHEKSTIYKVTSASMTWVFPQTGTFVMKESLERKINGSCPYTIKINGSTVVSGRTPLPKGYNSHACKWPSDIGKKEAEFWEASGKSVTVKKGDVVKFSCTSCYPCKDAGGSYCGIYYIKFVGSGTTEPPPPPPPSDAKIAVNPSSIAMSYTQGASFPTSVVSITNSGSGTLSSLSASAADNWLTLKVSGSGNSQKLTVTLAEKVATAVPKSYTSSIILSGKNVASKTIPVTLEVRKGKPTGVHSLVFGNGLPMGTTASEITVFNVQGRSVAKLAVGESILEAGKKPMPPGIYIIRQDGITLGQFAVPIGK